MKIIYSEMTSAVKLASNAGEVRVCAQRPPPSQGLWGNKISARGEFSASLLLLAKAMVSLTHFVSYLVLD